MINSNYLLRIPRFFRFSRFFASASWWFLSSIAVSSTSFFSFVSRKIERLPYVPPPAAGAVVLAVFFLRDAVPP